MVSIRRKLGAGENLRRLARKGLKDVADDLAAAADQGASVHPARRRIKLTRSMLRMLRPALPATVFERADQHLREAAGLLAEARRAEAMVEAAGKLGEPQLKAAAAQALSNQASAQDLKPAIAEASSHIELLREELSDWRLPKSDVRPFVRGMRRSYARARRLLAKGLASGEETVLHEGRKSVIHHLHHMEIVTPLWPEIIKPWRSELEALRVALGDLNDLKDMDAQLTDPQSGFAAIPDKTSAQKAIAARRAKLLASITRGSRRLFCERSGAFGRRIRALWLQFDAE